MLDRHQLESAGTKYPNQLDGLYAVAFGLLLCTGIGLANLLDQPVRGLWFGAANLLFIFVSNDVRRYYAETFGRATPTRGRQLRCLGATIAALGVGVGLHRLTGRVSGWPAEGRVNPLLLSMALGGLVFYAINARLRAFQVLVWLALAAAAIAPSWSRTVDRDAIAWLIVGASFVFIGVIEHLEVVRAFHAFGRTDLTASDVPA
jgi:hypothetical protein